MHTIRISASSLFFFYKCNELVSTKLKVLMNLDCLCVHALIFINILGFLRLNIKYLILKMMSASLVVNSQGHRKKSHITLRYIGVRGFVDGPF